MKDSKDHLDIDLEFLDKKDAAKPKPTASDASPIKDSTPAGSAPASKPHVETVDTDYKYNWKNILIIGGIILFFGWAIFSGSSDTPTTHTGNTLPPPALHFGI